MHERPILMSGPMSEEWRSLVGFEGRYEVSSLGKIRTLSRYRPEYYHSILSPWLTLRGYESVSLRLDGRRVSVSVHRAVMAAFVGPCPEGEQVAHNDGNRRNNRIDNLRYATPSSNIDDRRRHGRTARGQRNGGAKLDQAAARTILSLKDRGISASEIAHLACVHPSTVSAIWNGENWTNLSEAV